MLTAISRTFHGSLKTAEPGGIRKNHPVSFDSALVRTAGVRGRQSVCHGIGPCPTPATDSAAKAVVRAFMARDIEADGANPGGGTYPVAVKVREQR